MSRTAVIQSHLEALMQQLLDVEELQVTPRGLIEVVTEKAAYTVRLCPSCDEPHIEAFSIPIRDVPADPGLFEALNGLNRGLAHCRVFWVGEQVIVAGELLGASADLEGLRCLCNEVAGVAGHEASELIETFGGTRGWTEEEEQ